MNERIKELVKQAGTDCSGKWMGIDHAEKFAELIINECAIVANEWMDECESINYGVGWKIKHHFGVEDVDTQLRNRSTYFGNDY
jgi:hypothetical protein